MGELLNKIGQKAGVVITKSIDYDPKRATTIIENNFNNADKTGILTAALMNEYKPILNFATNTGKEVGKDFFSTNKKLIVVPIIIVASVGGIIGFAIGKYLKKGKKKNGKK